VSTEQPTTFTTAKVEKEPPTTPMKTTSARLQNRTEKKEQKEKKEKSAEILAHERMIDEKLAVYIKALETNDAATAREEFNNYLKLNLFVPPKYLGKGIHMFVKNEALWVRAHSQLGRYRGCIFSHAVYELVPSWHEVYGTPTEKFVPSWERVRTRMTKNTASG